jgi:succinyl-diaminopimelate desuccinylase
MSNAMQIEHSGNEMTEFMVEMLKIKAVNPSCGGKGEYDRAIFIQKWIEKLGGKVARYDFPDNRVPEGTRVNFTTVIEGRDTTRTLWFACHLDTVPEGARELWSIDPYDPVVKDGKIFGRGSEDNGQAIVSTLFAYRALKTSASLPGMNVGFAYVSDEEAGNKYGVIPMVERDVFKPRDMVIVPDTGSPDGKEIEVAEKSILWLRVATKGKQTHGGTPHKGLNANRIGMRFALEADELLHTKYAEADQLFNPPNSTFEPTKHELNVDNINTVPGLDVQYFDCRILTRYPLKKVMEDFESIKSRMEKETGAHIELTPIQMEENVAPTPTDSEVVKKLGKAVKELRGIETRPVGIGGGTVGLYFRRKGINTAVWSTLDNMAHQPNESCKIENMVNDAKVFLHLALN